MAAHPMSDEEAADFYADEANQSFDPTHVVRARPLADSIPVRFPPEVVAQVRRAADSEGITVSAWVRNAVTDALSQAGGGTGGGDTDSGDTDSIARQLEGLARRLRRSA